MTGDGRPAPRQRPVPRADDLAADRRSALSMFGVTPPTAARLDRFVDVLLSWQRHTNLVAPSTLRTLWTRHVADSLQVVDLMDPERERGPVVVDVGSGGGFPGVVLACAFAEAPGAEVHLVESIQKKAAFLREAVFETAAPGVVHAARLEQLTATLAKKPVDFVTARAVAPLPELLELIAPLLKTGARAVLMKGRDLDQELTESTRRWHIDAETVPSRTDATARILVVHRLRRRSVNAASRAHGGASGGDRASADTKAYAGRKAYAHGVASAGGNVGKRSRPTAAAATGDPAARGGNIKERK